MHDRPYNLCVLFDNVYCDFGYPALVLKKKRREAFAERPKTFFALEPDSVSLGGATPVGYTRDPEWPLERAQAARSGWRSFVERILQS